MMSHIYTLKTCTVFNKSLEFALSNLLVGQEVVHLYCSTLWSLLVHHLCPAGLVNCGPLLLLRFSEETPFLFCHPSVFVFFGVIHAPVKEHILQLHTETN